MEGLRPMTYPLHYRAVVEGFFEGSSGHQIERWSTSYRIASDGNFLAGDLDEDTYIDNELTDFCNRLFGSALYPSNVVVDKLAFNKIGPTGKYANSTSHFKQLAGSGQIRGTHASSFKFPPQLAIVATLRSHKTRGPGSHGRMFLPMPSVGITDDFVIADADVLALVAAVIDGLEHTDGTMAGTTGQRFYPALVTPKGSGEVHEVVQVKVDNVVDTMRSRRAQIQPFVRADVLDTW